MSLSSLRMRKVRRISLMVEPLVATSSILLTDGGTELLVLVAGKFEELHQIGTESAFPRLFFELYEKSTFS